MHNRRNKTTSIELGIKGWIFLLLLKTALADQIFIDEISNEVQIKSEPKRIVSLAPSITETLFAIGAGEKVVGVTDFCNYPEEARLKERVGGFINPNIEKILSLKPDIVFATKDGNDPQIVARLRKLKIPVYVSNPRDFDSILHSIIKISEIVGKAKEGRLLKEDIKRRQELILNKVRARKPKRVLFLYGIDPMVSAGSGTFADNLIGLAGGVNVLADSPVAYPKTNLEEAIARKPEIVIVSEMEGRESNLKRLINVPGWKIYRINGDLVNRPGPRIIEGIEELYKIIHGEEE
jgi:iron complex transport system substrate-binding protein